MIFDTKSFDEMITNFDWEMALQYLAIGGGIISLITGVLGIFNLQKERRTEKIKAPQIQGLNPAQEIGKLPNAAQFDMSFLPQS